MTQPGDEIWVTAPRGFRPSQWVEMLVDFDEAFNLDPHLVDPRRGPQGDLMVLSTRLLLTDCPLHRALLREMLDKVARLGLIIHWPPGLEVSLEVSQLCLLVGVQPP